MAIKRLKKEFGSFEEGMEDPEIKVSADNLNFLLSHSKLCKCSGCIGPNDDRLYDMQHYIIPNAVHATARSI